VTNAASKRVFFFGPGSCDGGLPGKEQLGGKGASLVTMTQAGLPVPPGFIISARCCQSFLHEDAAWPEGLWDEAESNLARLEELTGQSLGVGPEPLLLSVRSGAAVSMPGMMDTILNCGVSPSVADDVGPGGWEMLAQFILRFARVVDGIPESGLRASDDSSARSSPEDSSHAYAESYAQRTGHPFPFDPREQLRRCIEAVFRSWNSPRAKYYRRRNRIDERAGTAVTVQAMFPSAVSGVVFTEDPSGAPNDTMVIEASYGLGEAVVSGDVTPDQFAVPRADLRSVQLVGAVDEQGSATSDHGGDREMPHPCLADGQVTALCELALRVEGHFGKPVDVEWGWRDGEFALLQCREIRGLDVLRDVEVGRLSEMARLRELAAGGRRVWVVHNLSETLPAPRPLTWDIVRRFMSGSGGFGRLYRELGYRPSSEVCRNGFLELIGGRIYMDPERLAQLFWEGMPWAYDLEAVTDDPAVLDHPPGKFDPERTGPLFLFRLPGLVWAMMRASRRIRREGLTVAQEFETAAESFSEYVQAKRKLDLADLSEAQLLDEFDEIRGSTLDDFWRISLKPGFIGGLAFRALEELLTQLGGPEDGEGLAMALTAGLEGDVTVDQAARLHDVAADRLTMEEFLDEFGHRATDEMELAVPRWWEDPTYPEQIVQRIRTGAVRGPLETVAESRCRRETAEQDLESTLAKWGGSSFLEEVQAHVQVAQRLLPYRERGKQFLMLGFDLLRRVILALAERWGIGPEIFFLETRELREFQERRKELITFAAARKLRWQSRQRLALPEVIDSADLDGLGLPPEVVEGRELRGRPLAPGVATGTARTVMNPDEAARLEEGSILVCPSTDPGWTPLFAQIAGLVVERGGALSHGAIVARDFAIPAVACAEATRVIPDGTRIQVDANRGLVRILEPDADCR